MKTNLPTKIETKEQAEKFLTDLNSNNESFHPEDDAHEIIWNTSEVSHDEKEKLNELMGEVYSIENFDPCDFLMDLDS